MLVELLCSLSIFREMCMFVGREHIAHRRHLAPLFCAGHFPYLGVPGVQTHQKVLGYGVHDSACIS